MLAVRRSRLRRLWLRTMPLLERKRKRLSRKSAPMQPSDSASSGRVVTKVTRYTPLRALRKTTKKKGPPHPLKKKLPPSLTFGRTLARGMPTSLEFGKPTHGGLAAILASRRPKRSTQRSSAGRTSRRWLPERGRLRCFARATIQNSRRCWRLG
jgi:hypothetical protein